jgi:hypothetical protein
MRGLSRTFIDELRSGVLQPFLKLVHGDPTLCLEIREHYVNIYYRGGNILKITETGDAFDAWFDRKYLDQEKTRVRDELPDTLAAPDDVNAWIGAIPFLKHEMDLWFGEHPKDEREFQQLMVRENNFGNAAKSTDYFICDIEYANGNRRFDLIAVRWPSTSADRKNNTGLGLAFIEMKYLDKAMAWKAGLLKHIEDINDFLGDRTNLDNMKDEMKEVFKQKRELGLICSKMPIESFSDDDPEYILALANHDPDSSILKRELAKPLVCPHAQLKFAVSSFMGYGLYQEHIFTFDDFKRRFLD